MPAGWDSLGQGHWRERARVPCKGRLHYHRPCSGGGWGEAPAERLHCPGNSSAVSMVEAE